VYLKNCHIEKNILYIDTHHKGIIKELVRTQFEQFLQQKSARGVLYSFSFSVPIRKIVRRAKPTWSNFSLAQSREDLASKLYTGGTGRTYIKYKLELLANKKFS
jgi:hypothetical protein